MLVKLEIQEEDGDRDFCSLFGLPGEHHVQPETPIPASLLTLFSKEICSGIFPSQS